ncbi:DUF2511 domain-containing protein [Kitasatospora sp. NBC_01539]|uniref:DUF2511 domain-containing protein n=1 Tax=Kitasatospora sp. NBC_01539 TaxID=2903577 RepID=UPI0038601CCF
MAGLEMTADRAVPRSRNRVVYAVVGGLLVAGGAGWWMLGGEEHTREVSASTVSPWPFTVASGTLHCRSGGALTFEAGGTEYGLNGPAQDAGYPAPLPVWADAQGGGGLHMDMLPALDAAQALC